MGGLPWWLAALALAHKSLAQCNKTAQGESMRLMRQTRSCEKKMKMFFAAVLLAAIPSMTVPTSAQEPKRLIGADLFVDLHSMR
jgi:hypothetical protein